MLKALRTAILNYRLLLENALLVKIDTPAGSNTSSGDRLLLANLTSVNRDILVLHDVDAVDTDRCPALLLRRNSDRAKLLVDLVLCGGHIVNQQMQELIISLLVNFTK